MFLHFCRLLNFITIILFRLIKDCHQSAKQFGPRSGPKKLSASLNRFNIMIWFGITFI